MKKLASIALAAFVLVACGTTRINVAMLPTPAPAPTHAAGETPEQAAPGSNSAAGATAIGTLRKYGYVITPPGGGGGGGITNGAGANVVMKSDGTNAVASLATDDGTTFSIGSLVGHILDFNGQIAKFGFSQDGATYINNNILGFAYGTNGTATGFVNYTGYQAGTTQFRDLEIADGKNGQVAYFTGSTKAVEFNGAVTADSGITSTAGTNTLGQVVETIQTQTTSSGALVNDLTINASTTVIAWTATVSSPQWTGMTGGANGRRIKIINTKASTVPVTIFTENTNSTTAADRFTSDGGTGGYVLAVGCEADATFDGTNSRWQIVFSLCANTPGGVTVNGTLGVTGAATMSSTLGVTGATTLNAHLITKTQAVSLTNATCNSTICTNVAGTITTTSTAPSITFTTATGADDLNCHIQPLGTAAAATSVAHTATSLSFTATSSGKYSYVCISTGS